jgi:hypothetical protein
MNPGSRYAALVTTNLSSRALPLVVVGFSLVFFWALVWFAIAGGGNLTDPTEILTQGAQATAQADSFHLSLAGEGSVEDRDSGDPVSLDGVSVEGDVDVAGDAAQVSFALPMLFGMSGEAIVIGEDMYLLSPMAGDHWLHLTSTSDEGEEPAGEPPTDEEIAAKVEELLTTDGVGIAKLADQPCGDDTCYHLQLSISAEAMAAHGEGMPDMGGEMSGMGDLMPNPKFSGPAVVDLLFQQNGLWLRSVTVASDGKSGDVSMTLDLSEYNTAFDITAPPADQVIEAEDFPLFP